MRQECKKITENIDLVAVDLDRATNRNVSRYLWEILVLRIEIQSSSPFFASRMPSASVLIEYTGRDIFIAGEAN